jgi:hypothetical protein
MPSGKASANGHQTVLLLMLLALPTTATATGLLIGVSNAVRVPRSCLEALKRRPVRYANQLRS